MEPRLLRQLHPRLVPWPRDIAFPIRAWAFLEALVILCWMDLCGCVGFNVLHRIVRRTRVAATPVSYDALSLVRVAMRDACIFYVKPVACLQRSAAVIWMLRRRGVAASLILGYQIVPFAGHAWVEVDGRVVWDALSTLPHYRVLDRL